tara:strand:+ start:24 stop:1412 length:1389 start_codon:yes stop_codon:yes gene_type:complete
LDFKQLQLVKTKTYNAKKLILKNEVSLKKLDKLFSKFEVFNIPIETILQDISSGQSSFNLDLEGSYFLKLNLSLNKIVAENFVLSSKETQSSPSVETSTYSGNLSDDHSSKLRFSIRENHFSGIILRNGTTYCFEPLQRYSNEGNVNSVIVYQLKDVNGSLEGVCGEVDPSQFLEKVKSGGQNSKMNDTKNLSNCSLIEIAVAADNSMLTKFGGDTSLVQTEIIDLLNLAELLYATAPLEIRYRLVEIYIATPDEITLDSETDGLVILADFRTFGLTGGFINSFGVATMWTDRDFEFSGSFSTAGLAYIDAICGSYRFNLIEHFPSGVSTPAHLSLLYAHELGHNWGANHTATNSVNVMSPIIYSTNYTWSATSISDILAKKATSSCLLSCDIPFAHFNAIDTLICEGSTVAFSDTSHGNPTSYQWSFPGGIPSSSTLQNPSVQYNSVGSYDVKLVISTTAG